MRPPGKKIIEQYKAEDGKTYVRLEGVSGYIPTDSKEYMDLYDKGILYGEDNEGRIYTQSEKSHPLLSKYAELVKQNTFKDYMTPYFEDELTGAIARGMGQSIDKFWEVGGDYKENYDKQMAKALMDDLFSAPQNEDEERGAYIDRVISEYPEELKAYVAENLNPEQQTSLWQDMKRGAYYGFEGLPGSESLENNILNDSALSQQEKSRQLKDLKDKPWLSRLTNTADVLAPLAVGSKLVQSAFLPNYSAMDALKGKKNDASVMTDIVTDPLNLVGVGLLSKTAKAGLISKPISKLDFLNGAKKVEAPLAANPTEFNLREFFNRITNNVGDNPNIDFNIGKSDDWKNSLSEADRLELDKAANENSRNHPINTREFRNNVEKANKNGAFRNLEGYNKQKTNILERLATPEGKQRYEELRKSNPHLPSYAEHMNIIDNTHFNPIAPDGKVMEPDNAHMWFDQYIPRSYVGQNFEDDVAKVVEHEFSGHLNQYGRELYGVDSELNWLKTKGTPSPYASYSGEFPDRTSTLSPEDANDLDYFNTGSGRGMEKAAYLAETKQGMVESGYLKHHLDEATPEQLSAFYNDYMGRKKTGIKQYENNSPVHNERLFNFLQDDPGNFKILSETMNRLPTIGIGVGLPAWALTQE